MRWRRTLEDWQRLKEWFGSAADAGSSERDALIAIACRESPELGAALRSLLAEHDRPEFETAAFYVPNPDAGKPELGRTVGPYRILRELGRGGAGIVFLAERSDNDFHHLVALKLLRCPAWDETLRRQFHAERRLMAQLRHPAIATLIDWGVTPEGTPWLAMEYVAGKPVDVFCAEVGFTIDQKLNLFLRVCEAVQYAHQNLVVHRDLKPANILVLESGSSVKLLDFGIAKLLDDASEQTATIDRKFTPAYASPEQVIGGHDPQPPRMCTGWASFCIRCSLAPCPTERRRPLQPGQLRL